MSQAVDYPRSNLCEAALAFARSVSPPVLFNHVMRTFAFGEAAGEARGLRYDRELFFLGAVLHDLGLSRLAKGEVRFEIEGADAAKEFLSRQGMRDTQIDIVWDAIALHSIPGLPTRKRAEIALVQLGAAIDIGVVPVSVISDPRLSAILAEWPRLDFKRAFLELFVALYRKNPASAESYVTSDICARHIPGFQAPNLHDVIQGAAFAE